jgi:hypothetical protein
MSAISIGNEEENRCAYIHRQPLKARLPQPQLLFSGEGIRTGFVYFLVFSWSQFLLRLASRVGPIQCLYGLYPLFFLVLGFELRGSQLLGSSSTT